MAAAPGNQYAAKERVWTAAINKALEKRSALGRMEALADLAEKLLEQCSEGNLVALKELGDRLEGKPTQTIEGDLNVVGIAGILSGIAASEANDLALEKGRSSSIREGSTESKPH